MADHLRQATCALAFLALATCNAGHEEILLGLTSPDPARRIQAIRRAASFPREERLRSLISKVNDPSSTVRTELARALGDLDDRRCSEALGELAADVDENVQLAAIAALSRESGSAAHAYLLAAYIRGSSEARALVAKLLTASSGSPAAAVSAEAAALWARYSNALTREGILQRMAAAEELGRSGRTEAIERLTNYLGAEPHSLAAAAARGLGDSGQPEAREPLETLLTEDDPDLEVVGAMALGELGLIESGPALSRVVERGGKPGRAALAALERIVAKQSKGSSGELKGQMLLRRARQGMNSPSDPSGDGDPEGSRPRETGGLPPKLEELGTLLHLPGFDASASIRRALFDTQPHLRAMTAQMLRSIWGDATVLQKAPEITALANDYYVEVRRAVSGLPPPPIPH